LSFCYDIANNCGLLSNLCHVVYATKGFTTPHKQGRRLTQTLGKKTICRWKLDYIVFSLMLATKNCADTYDAIRLGPQLGTRRIF